MFTLPGGATQVGEEWLDPAWRGARATDATDPWGSSRASSALPGLELPGGASLTATGGLQIGGLEWLGARVYDPAARGFLSVDPIAPVTGAAWAGNPYSYAGNDPMHALDPLGLKPATDADLDAYAAANQSVMGHVSDWADDHAYLIAGAAIVGGALLMATGVGGPLGLALISGGVDVGLQKFTTGEVNWAQAAGSAALGAVGGAGLMAGRFAAKTAASAPRVARAVAINAGVNGTAGAVGGAGSYVVENGLTWDGRKFAGKVIGGTVGGVVSGVAKPVGGSLSRALDKQLTEAGTDLARGLAKPLAKVSPNVWEHGISGAGGMGATSIDGFVSGEGTTWKDLAFGGTVGTLTPLVPGGPTQMTTLNQMARTNPSSLHGMFNGVQSSRLWQSGATGVGVGWSIDSTKEAFDNWTGASE